MIEISFDIRTLYIYLGAIAISGILSRMLLKPKSREYKERVWGDKPSLISCIIVASPMALVLGFRSIMVGCDTIRYVENFYRLLAYLPETEFLFTRIVRLAHQLGGAENYTLMLTTFSFIGITVPIYAVTRIQERHDNTIYVLLFGFMFFLCSADQIRQMIAVGFLALTIVYFEEKRYIASVVSIVLGFGFHNTIIIGIIIYVLCVMLASTKQNTVVLKLGMKRILSLRTSILQLFSFIAVPCVVIILLNYIDVFYEIVSMTLPSYTKYLTRYQSSQPIGFGWILDTMIIIPLFFLGKNINNRLERACWLFALTAIPLRFLGYQSYFLSRMIYFPQIITLLLYSKLIIRTKEEGFYRYCRRKCLLIFIALSYLIIKFAVRNEHGVFPYQFWWEHI